MEENIEFERCIEFLVRMIEKYGDIVFKEYMDRNQMPEQENE